jgi:hypothetical protein
LGGKAQLSEDGRDHSGVGDERDDPAATETTAALGHFDLVDATRELRPREVAKPER